MSQFVLLRQITARAVDGRLRCLRWKNRQSELRPFTITVRHQKRNALQQATERTDVSTDVRPLGEKIKENTKTASYTAVILAGIGVTGIMFYAIFRELFSSCSPNNVYSKALNLAKEDPRVQDALGSPIKGFGEESRRGRRQHVAHSNYERNGVPHMRMQFYIQGIRNRATVHLEMRRKGSGGEEFRYLYVQLDHYPHTTIVLEDNRASDPVTTAQYPSASISTFNADANGRFGSAGALDLTGFEKKQ